MFENPLKGDTKEAVEGLKEAAITMVMITGDNSLTACYIAIKSGIADAFKRMLIVDCSGNELEVEQYQQRTNSEGKQKMGRAEFFSSIDQEEDQLCLTGAAFSLLFEDVSELTEKQKRLLLQCKVFARTKPLDKAKVVLAYQQMGRKTGMCGDGANDSRALKQADVGLSLSET